MIEALYRRVSGGISIGGAFIFVTIWVVLFGFWQWLIRRSIEGADKTDV